jgi:NADH:ubiquinone oxidoreductase subunit 6 (subunit J)
MLVSHIFDLVPIWVLLLGTILLMVLFIETGFRLGQKALAGSKKTQTAQVRAIMGAGLGLLAFMLAFTFSTAQTHFETRVQSLAEEARIARNAFMQADLLAEPERSQAKQLLKDYINIRSGLQQMSGQNISEQLAELVQVSEQIQQDLWSLATRGHGKVVEDRADNGQSEQFMASVIALTDIHFTRLHSAVMNRIPFTIWMTLYLMAILSMIIMGYQAGLTDRRSPIATITLAVAFSAVIILITDLDRPVMSFFEINKQLLVDLNEYMEADLSLEYYPGDQGSN